MRRSLLAVVLAGCSFELTAPSTTGGDGGPGVDSPADPDSGVLMSADAPGAWSSPTPISSLTGADDPTLTGDLLELYFNANGDIYGMKRASPAGAWSNPFVVTELSSGSTETTPEVSADGLTMVISSDRAGGLGGTELWISTRTQRSDPWRTPTVMTGLNWTGADASGVMSTDLLSIALTSDRGGAMSDVYLSQRVTTLAPWSIPASVMPVNTPNHEGSAFLSGDKLMVCFDTNRTGDYELYCASRASASDPFGAPQPLPAPINSTSAEEDIWLSPDGSHIVFTSSRSPGGLFEASR